MQSEIVSFDRPMLTEACRLVRQAFGDAEGENEGRVISELVEQLVMTTDPGDLKGFVSLLDDNIVAVVFFSRLSVPEGQRIFMLSPMAVATKWQHQGLGSNLIRHGLHNLWNNGVALVVTYGDPAYYGRFGFKQILSSTLCPPWPLSQPVGWQAVSASGLDIEPMEGQTTCVAAFNNPAYW